MELHNVILKGTGSEFELRKYQGFGRDSRGLKCQPEAPANLTHSCPEPELYAVTDSVASPDLNRNS